MTSDPDKYWESVVGKLRRAQGMCPLTPEEAQAAFDAAPAMPLSEEDIRRMTNAAMSGNSLGFPEHIVQPRRPEASLEVLDAEPLQLCREGGEESAESQARESELEDKLLNDDHRTEGGMEENPEPPGLGR